MRKKMKKLAYLLLALFTVSCFHEHSTKGQNELVYIQIIDRNGMNETISSKERLEKYNKVNFLESQPYKQVVRIFDSKNPQKSSIITTYHPNGLIYQYLEVANARACGKYRQWHANGKLEIAASVIGGPAGVSAIEQKEWIFNDKNYVWDENGNLISYFNYEKGDLEGSAYYYYANGQVKKIEPYHKNELEGEVLEYNDRNELISKSNFKQGKKQGIAEGFFDKNQPAYLEKYDSDLLVEGKYFDAQGNLCSEINKGCGIKTFLLGEQHIVTEYKNGRPEGKISFFKEGCLQSFYHIKDGKKHGEEVEFYPNINIPKLSVFWSEDSLHGTVKTWYQDGNIESQKELFNNKKNGTSTAWYQNGSIMLIEEYEHDRLIKGSYYKNNETIPISNVFNGKGTVTLFDEKGIFLRTIKYENGRPEVE